MKATKITLIILSALLISVTMWALNESEEDRSQKVTFEDTHVVSLEEAAEFTARYRAQMDEGETKIGGMFARSAIDRIMNQDGVMGLRYYHGLNAEGENVIVLVGVDKDNRDMLHGELAEMALPCPPFCFDENELNSNVSMAKAQLNQ